LDVEEEAVLLGMACEEETGLTTDTPTPPVSLGVVAISAFNNVRLFKIY
jgi:hypothetical protein